MRLSPVRAEFVIAGSALVLTVVWGWEAIRALFGWAELPWVHELLVVKSTSGAWIFAAAVTLGVAYVVGAIVVQITFERPTKSIIAEVQAGRLHDLRAIDMHLREKVAIEATTPKEIILKQIFEEDRPSASFVKLGQSIGRAALNEELNEQYNYRRGNRQIFVGIIPAVFVVPFDVGASLMSLHAPTYRYIIGSLATVALLVLMSEAYRRVLKPAARYQEEIAQGIIIDAAFLERWSSEAHFKPRAGRLHRLSLRPWSATRRSPSERNRSNDTV